MHLIGTSPKELDLSPKILTSNDCCLMGIVMLLNWDTFRWCWGAPSPASSASPSPVMGYTQNQRWPRPTCFLTPHTHRAKSRYSTLRSLRTVPGEQGRQWSLSAYHGPNPNPCSPAAGNVVHPLGLLSFTGSPISWPGCGCGLSWRSTSKSPSSSSTLPMPKVIIRWHFMLCKSSRETQLAQK